MRSQQVTEKLREEKHQVLESKKRKPNMLARGHQGSGAEQKLTAANAQLQAEQAPGEGAGDASGGPGRRERARQPPVSSRRGSTEGRPEMMRTD